MAESESGCKVKEILHSDWLPEWAKFGPFGISYMYTVCWSCKKEFSFWPYKKSFIDQTCSVKMSGYWPHFCPFFVLDFAVLSALPETTNFGVNLLV